MQEQFAGFSTFNVASFGGAQQVVSPEGTWSVARAMTAVPGYERGIVGYGGRTDGVSGDFRVDFWDERKSHGRRVIPPSSIAAENYVHD